MSTRCGAVNAAKATISQRKAAAQSGVATTPAAKNHHNAAASIQARSIVKPTAATVVRTDILGETTDADLDEARQTRHIRTGAW
ncbi:MAG: hypothetical protein H7197_08495 [Vitreoscilla sp.]|nr:hypothetical protein [Polaromonas sp.]